MPISERDYLVTDRRFFYLIQTLSRSFAVEVVTISKEVFDDITVRLGDNSTVTVTLLHSERLPLTLDFRTNLVKIFVQYTDGLFLPGTDLKLWKTAAFDDFWGHISTCSFPDLPSIDSDIILLPLMSYDDTPSEDMDVFYTTVVFKAREKGVTVVGYQLYPVFQGLKLMPLFIDAFLVKKEYEKKYYLDRGIPPERIYIITDEKDSYAVSSISDTYKDALYNAQIQTKKNEIAIVIYNHMKYRPEIRQIIKAIGNAKVPVVLSLVKRDYYVKDLHEDAIIKDFYFDDIKRLGCTFYLVETQSSVPITMISDVIISPTYISPVEFAARYGKKSFVYNPLYDAGYEVEGASFFNSAHELSSAIKRAYEEKQKTVSIADVLARL